MSNEFLIVIALILGIVTICLIILLNIQKESLKITREMNVNYRDLDRLKDKRYSKLLVAQGKLLACVELFRNKEAQK